MALAKSGGLGSASGAVLNVQCCQYCRAAALCVQIIEFRCMQVFCHRRIYKSHFSAATKLCPFAAVCGSVVIRYVSDDLAYVKAIAKMCERCR